MACKHASSHPVNLLHFQSCERVSWKSLFLLPLCQCQGQRNHEIAQGSQWGTLFSVTQRKSFVITRLKSYPVKIESNISSPHTHFQRQSPCLWFHIFLAPPTPSTPHPPSLTPHPPHYLSPLFLFHVFSLPVYFYALFYILSNFDAQSDIFYVISFKRTQELDCT